MAKKKFTDDEYLKILNEQLEKFENNNDLSTSDPLNSEQEYDILKMNELLESYDVWQYNSKLIN